MDTTMCELILVGASLTSCRYYKSYSNPYQIASIDKTSSAELPEAINSMYKWYSEADICYAYLSDVKLAFVDHCAMDTLNTSRPTKDFNTTKWFTRGWTLQELIAPRSVEFYAEDWTDLGTKSSRRDEISLITGIDVRVLDG